MLLKCLLAVPRAFDIQNPWIVKCASGLFGLWTSAADAASRKGARKWKILCLHRDDLPVIVKLYVTLTIWTSSRNYPYAARYLPSPAHTR